MGQDLDLWAWKLQFLESLQYGLNYGLGMDAMLVGLEHG